MNTIHLDLYDSLALRTTSRTFSEGSRVDDFDESEGLVVTAELAVRAIRGEVLPKGWTEIARMGYPHARSLRLRSGKELVATATVEVTGGMYSGVGESRACASVPLHESLMSGEVCGENPDFGREAKDWVDAHRDAIEKRLIRGARIISTNWRWLAMGDYTGIAEVALPKWGADFHEARAYIALSPNYAEE